jgi:hypothetical protein
MSLIPKKIIQTWENKNIDPEFQQIIDTWKVNNPTYEYYLFDKEERYQFIKENFNQIILDTYDTINPGANKADFFRYCYLYICGGVATDIDNLCIGHLDDFLLPNIEFVTAIDLNKNPIEGQHNLALGTLMAIVPNHPIMLNCINRIVYNYRNNITYPGLLDVTGPGVLGRAVNTFLGNEETTSFIGKEGIIGNIHLLKFEDGIEYFKDLNGNVLGQNKCGNPDILRLYKNECQKLNNYISWTECQQLYKPSQRKNIALMVYGQFRSYKNNLRRNIQMLEPIIKTHNIHLFVLSDKKTNGNYSPENEKEIREIFKEFYFNVHIFYYMENYDNINEENETAAGYYENIRHENGSNPFVPNLMYRKYLLNKLKNEFVIKNNMVMDMTIYCRIFDIVITNNLSFNEIENQINEVYENPNILFGSSDTFFIGSQKSMDYLFDIAVLFKEGKPYHDDIWEDKECEQFISTMDYCLCNVRHIYSPELQYIVHMYYSPYTYKNMRVDFTNPTSELNKGYLFHVRLDDNRK